MSEIYEGNYIYNFELLSEAGNLPLDIARSLLTSHSISITKANCAGRKRLTGSQVQCPRCNTPRIANLIRCRLLGYPRDKRHIKNLLKRERKYPKKLTLKEKSTIEAYRTRKNTVEVTCVVCHHKVQHLFSIPGKRKVVQAPQVKKKKKKRNKEMNAGLTLKTLDSTENNLENKDERKLKDTERKESMKGKSIYLESKKRKNEPKFNEEESMKGKGNYLESKRRKNEPSNIYKEEVKSDSIVMEKRKPKKTLKLDKNTEMTVGEGSKLDKTLAERIQKSLTQTSSNLDTQNTSKSNIGSVTLPTTQGKKSKKRKKLACLQNSVIKDIMKESKSTTQNDTLGDFLKSLF